MALYLNSDDASFSSQDLTSSLSLVTYTADMDRIVGVRADIGTAGGLLSSTASEVKIVAKITSGSEVREAYSRTINKIAGETLITHNFDKTINLLSGEVLAIWVESNNSSDSSISGNIYIIEDLR